MVRILALLLALTALPAHPGIFEEEPPRFEGDRNVARSGDDFTVAALAAAPMAGDSFLLVRCGGLYRSIRLHGGEALGEARIAHARRVEARLARAAAITRAAEYGQGWQNALVAARTDIAAIARLYLARYERMIAETGRPWSRDPLWAADTAACSAMLRAD